MTSRCCGRPPPLPRLNWSGSSFMTRTIKSAWRTSCTPTGKMAARGTAASWTIELTFRKWTVSIRRMCWRGAGLTLHPDDDDPEQAKMVAPFLFRFPGRP
jgi:hypothetical protein